MILHFWRHRSVTLQFCYLEGHKSKNLLVDGMGTDRTRRDGIEWDGARIVTSTASQFQTVRLIAVIGKHDTSGLFTLFSSPVAGLLPVT